jgi:hypothetical protein
MWESAIKTIEALGPNGMSSDESDVDEDTHEQTLKASVLLWRRDLDNFLDAIDSYRWEGGGAYSNQGTRPLRRLRSDRISARLAGTHAAADGIRVSSRKPVTRLPESFYDPTWVGSHTIVFIKQSLQPKTETWTWFNMMPA